MFSIVSFVICFFWSARFLSIVGLVLVVVLYFAIVVWFFWVLFWGVWWRILRLFCFGAFF